MTVTANMPSGALPYAELLEGGRLPGTNWDDFRVFLAVVEAGSIHRAAATVGLSQPTTSRRLDRLEKAIGVRLFDRNRGGTRLTHEGMRVYNEVSSARFALTRAARSSHTSNRKIEGDCKIVMGDGLASFWLPHFVGRFFSAYPNIELKMFVSHDAVGTKNEIFDVQLHYFEPVETDPVSVRLGTLHFMPFASRRYIEQFGAPTTLQELSNHRVLGHTGYLIDKGTWAGWMNETATHSASLLTNQSGPLAACVKSGAGIALLPTYVAATDDEFVPLNMGTHFPLAIFMSFQRATAKKWPVRATIDFLKDVVFYRKAMPWFADEFETPKPGWKTLFEAHTRAGEGEKKNKVSA
jgi:DNA-binding transcriptional LysR family regulator